MPVIDAPRLVVHTAEPDADHDLRGPAVAYSLHLRLLRDSTEATQNGGARAEIALNGGAGAEIALNGGAGVEIALNGGAGVAFAKGVLVGDDVHEARTLRDPFLLRGDGEWVVLALRGLPDGRPEAVVLVLTSDDLVDWHEIRAIPVDPGASRPWGSHDSGRYVIAWTDISGRRRHTTLADLRSGSPGTLADSWPGELAGGRPGQLAGVRSDEPTDGRADELTDRRSDEPTDRRSDEPESERPSTPADGPSRLGVPLPLAVADALVERLPGAAETRPVDDFPFIADRADPCVFRYDGRWYFIATDDLDGRNEDARGLLIRVADSIDGLRDAADHSILGTGVAGIKGCFWAPELHVFGGRLHCLFSPSIGTAEWSGVQSHIMTLRPGCDPTRPEGWDLPRPVLKADGTPLQRDPEHPGISLDMTYFEDAGRSYVAWSQRYILDVTGDAEIWIATIDPERPDRLTSDPVRLISPEFGWELNDANVVEGPYFLRHGDEIHLTYSAAGVGPRYAMGLMTAEAGADLLDPRVWRKLGRPLLSSDSVPGQFGPGHNTFVRDENDDLLLVFHALTGPHKKGRDTGLRRVSWAPDGRPVLERSDGSRE